MKEIEKSLLKNFNPLGIFLDDLYVIEEIFNKNCKNFKIQTENHEFDSVEELKSRHSNETINKLDIKAREPYISISLSKNYAYLYTAADDSLSEGVFSKLSNVLVKNERYPNFLIAYWPLLIGLNTIIFVCEILLRKYFPRNILNVIEIIAFLWVFYTGYISLKKFSEINLVKKSDKQSFFFKNKDAIGVGLITAILTLLLTLFIQNIFP